MPRPARKSRQSPPSDGDGGKFARLVEWLNAHADALLDDPGNNLIGVGIGKKSAGPLDDDAPFCITGFVLDEIRGALGAKTLTVIV
jgi:hypothetical protein